MDSVLLELGTSHRSVSEKGWSTALLASLLGTFLGGCAVLPSHLHSDEREKTALAAQKEFADYSAAAPALYAAMSTNVAKFKIEEDNLLTELGKNYEKALAADLTTLPWSKVSQHIDTGTGIIANFETSTLRTQLAKIRQEIDGARVEKMSADDIKKKVTAELKKAKEEVNLWNAEIALLQQGFKDLDLKTRPTSPQDAGDALKKLGEKEITYTDADGTAQKEKVQEILTKLAKDTTEPLLKEESASSPGKSDKASGNKRDAKAIFGALSFKAPGIRLLVLNNALALAKLHLREAEAKLSQAAELKALLEDTLAELRLAQQLYQDAKETVAQRTNPAEYPASTALKNWGDYWSTKDLIMTQLKAKAEADAKLATSGTSAPTPAPAAGPSVNDLFTSLQNHENSTAIIAVAIRKVAIADSIVARVQASFSLKAERLEHLNSITNSALADEARRTLIKTQIDGLVAYHQGGFTKEDAATIVRLAQTAALFLIASNMP